MVFAVANTVEAWPVTSLRLFSGVRTAQVVSYELIAYDHAGGEYRVRADANNAFVARTSSQYARLARDSASTQHAKAVAWVAAAGLDPADMREVVLWRTRAQLVDHGEHRRTLDRRAAVRIELSSP